MKKVLDFYAPWCGPCKAAEKTIFETASKLGLDVEKVNVEDRRSVFDAFGVKTVPTLVVVEDSKEVGRLSGVLTSEKLTEFFTRHV